ncbi:polycystic kidney disease 2-like 1 protein [Teleopsis dalmanni]|uniref:polycystic kidney disease 2-like 1 protein n=1 Tax=Teleopsis dalmanni TaxID=139649 RepID=UPI0018CD7662|nr:polycystic kidney disease 2-like 1 protein [Teleopsis dalmanni]
MKSVSTQTTSELEKTTVVEKVEVVEVVEEVQIKKTTHKNYSTRYENDIEIRNALKEFLLYLLFLIVALIVASSVNHKYMFYLYKTIENLFIITPEYYDLVTIAEWWLYAENGFAPALLGDNNGNDVINERYFLEENILLGAPRLRQIRVKSDSCHIPDAFKRYFSDCYAQYHETTEEKEADFQGSKFYTLDELNDRPIWAKYATYYGAGYVQELDYNMNATIDTLESLKEEKWIDRATRVVVLEFGLYNANGDFFTNVKIIAETPISGGIITSKRLESFNTHEIWTDDDYLLIICAIIFYIMIVFYTTQAVREWRLVGWRNYFSSLWNIVDVLILTMAYLAFVYQIIHIFLVKALLKRVTEDEDGFHSLDNICFWSSLYADLLAVCAFFICIKVFKYISFNKTLLQFSTTLQRCAKDLLGFGLMFLIVFLAYAQLGLLLFGAYNYDFCTFWESLITLLRMILGDFDYAGIESANRILGPLYFLSYILLVFFILLNMFLAIINDTYSAVKEEITAGKNEVIVYLKKIFKKVFERIIKRRKKEDRDLKNVEAPAEKGSETTLYPRTSLTTTRSAKSSDPEVIYVTESEVIRDYFEVYEPPANRLQLNSLSDRVTLLEKILEGLIVNLDTIIKKVDAKKRRDKKNA